MRTLRIGSRVGSVAAVASDCSAFVRRRPRGVAARGFALEKGTVRVGHRAQERDEQFVPIADIAVTEIARGGNRRSMSGFR
ncbi:protein of unknown function [Candidatus Filomicrobium marinum]|uniref:Uncharacterized protein n=1 Tax=Candidatus Filomicrobium marinum TaxID=1608628 RepID=A0A0D6JH07_9HYPH|nr:protein of unknown function [Candidatus Filomicrobium marinum]CPR20520.1 protein of unknown function [Candidatus Filomicrobium marinum]